MSNNNFFITSIKIYNIYIYIYIYIHIYVYIYNLDFYFQYGLYYGRQVVAKILWAKNLLCLWELHSILFLAIPV